MVKTLLQNKNANPNPSEPKEVVPLSIACKVGNLDIIRMLITNELHPANPNETLVSVESPLNQYEYTTPFLQAITSGNIEVIRLLLTESLVKVELENRGNLIENDGLEYSVTALTLALRQVNIPVVKMLLQSKADPNYSPLNDHPFVFSDLPIHLALKVKMSTYAG